MRFWQYFNVGVRVIIPYSNASFSSGLKRGNLSGQVTAKLLETSLSSKKEKIRVINFHVLCRTCLF